MNEIGFVPRTLASIPTAPDRRAFLTNAAKTLGGAAAAAFLPFAGDAHAAVIAEDDARIASERITFAGATTDLRAYLAAPKVAVFPGGQQAGILVVHEGRGLDRYIEGIARRLATLGYVALAVDFLSPLGGTPADDQAAAKLVSQLDPVKTTADAHAGISALRARADSNGKVGALGFCWGGGLVNRLAADLSPRRAANIDAGVVYYGAPPPLDAVPNIAAPLLLNYAASHRNGHAAALPAYERALKKAGIHYELYMYPDASRPFEEESKGGHCDPAAAKLAWNRMSAFFQTNLT